MIKATLRSVVFPGGNELLAFAWTGRGGLMARDPALCLSARLDRLKVAHPADDAIRSAASKAISTADDTNTDLQRIAVARFHNGRKQGDGGIRIVNARPATGIFGSQIGPSRSSGSYFYGLAIAGTARAVVRRTGRDPFRAAVAIRHGLFAFDAPAGAGLLTLRYLTARGKVLAVQRYRPNGAPA